MSAVADRLSGAGLAIPSPAAPVGAYVPARRSGSLVFTSGQLPMREGSLITSGLVGDSVDLETARDCARQAVLNALAAASTVCDLDAVISVVKLTGYVACVPGFSAQPAVIDGASAVLVAAFGDDAGRHARAAVGVASLPLSSPVELDLILEVS